jgi:porin
MMKVKSRASSRAAKVVIAAGLLVCARPGLAGAAEAARPAAVTLELHETVEGWRNRAGGVAVGDTTLNKLQVSAAFDGEAVGWHGFSAYGQLFKTNSESLSGGRTGDVQTVSNIEAPGVNRLMELWVAQGFGDEDAAGWVQVRGGVIDLNRTFDSIATAGLFINSSHGIGPDLSHSGVSGPSIFPVGGPAVQADWRPTSRLTLHAGVFATPDPNHLNQVADLRTSSRNGAIAITQADYTPGRGLQASLAVWRYTSRQAGVAEPDRRFEPRPGAYAFVQGPTQLPGAPKGWLRAGFADRRLQDVSGYLGGGLAWEGLLPGRSADAFGLAVGRAMIGAPARSVGGLPAAETTWEATYSFQLGPHLHVQPDLQHIVHPASAPGLKNATVVGLRLSLGAELTGG